MLVYLKCMFFVTAALARSAGASYGQVQATILVNNGNVQIGPKQKHFPRGWGNLTFTRCPGVGNLTLASMKMSKSPGSARPPHPGA